MRRLTGKTAIVTGASSGIGRGIALELARAGAHTVLAARNETALAELAGEIADLGSEALAVRTDVSREADILALFSACQERFGAPDILVNNAGMADATPTHELTRERWQQVLDTNLTSYLLCSREAIRAMKARGAGGRIINIGSISAKKPRENSAAYTTTKFAIDGLTRSIALDYREDLITASVIHPGATRSMIAPGFSDTMEGDCLEPHHIGELVCLICGLPADTTLLDTLILPVRVPFLGRG